MSQIKNNFIESVGNTPLIKLKAASEITGCNIYGKAEYLNPDLGTPLFHKYYIQ